MPGRPPLLIGANCCRKLRGDLFLQRKRRPPVLFTGSAAFFFFKTAQPRCCCRGANRRQAGLSLRRRLLQSNTGKGTSLEAAALCWSSAAAAVKLGWSCNGALSEPSELCQGCNEARPELQWSFAGASVLRWSSAEAAMELSRSYNGTLPERWCRVGTHRTPSVLHWSFMRGCSGPGLKLTCSLLPAVIQRHPTPRSNG